MAVLKPRRASCVVRARSLPWRWWRRSRSPGAARRVTAALQRAAATDDVCKTANGSGPKVGLAYDVGGRGDQSFNDSAYAGVSKAVTEFDGSCLEGEAQDGEPESAREDRLTQMADERRHRRSSASASPTATRSTRSPPTTPRSTSRWSTGSTPTRRPTRTSPTSASPRTSPRYLVGVAAALTTKTKQVGFVGGVHNDLIKNVRGRLHRGRPRRRPEDQGRHRLHPGEQPVRLQRPGRRQDRRGRSSSTRAPTWSTTPPAPPAPVSSTPRSRPATGNWAIGVDSDQYLTATAAQKPHILTSALKRVDVASLRHGSRRSTTATRAPATMTYDLKNNGVGYSTSGGFLDEHQRARSTATPTRSRAAQIKVPTTP